MINSDTLLQFLTMDMKPEQQRAVIKFCWRAGVALHIAIACGWLGWVGMSGFAFASEVDHVKSDVSDLRRDIMEADAFELRIQQCAAIKARESTLVYSQRLTDLLARYQELNAGRMYSLPTCQDLGVIQ